LLNEQRFLSLDLNYAAAAFVQGAALRVDGGRLARL
jgi:hypothetical protein